MFDYKDLKLRIIKYFDTQEAFADAMEMSRTALSQRLNNKVFWSNPEIIKACELLEIPLNEIHVFFYKLKVLKQVL